MLIDNVTRFCEAIPILTQETEVNAREFVVRVITHFGVPKKLLTDRGASFTSALIKEVASYLRCKRYRRVVITLRQMEFASGCISR
jgi:transposase-like protein